ncbi:acetyltransferase (GNAT) family domain-containing protein [Ditylenchus destructor]|uniref:Acetyltransferase (GNAT) family domain-containing protein n=1 Tax=Ditylenchus destructor TaxID=166010 RepID=A0AAD4MTH3_9BILA|nr:acetyltransferase (GNAT) family domain-containing protein [Ditylenchus destructor]
MEFRIRVAEPKDAGTILSLMQVFSDSLQANYDPSLGKFSPRTRISSSELTQALDRKHIHIFLAYDEESGELAGMISCYEGFSCWDAKYLYMHHMFVIPKFRRRGLARRLIQELAIFAISRDASAIYWAVEDENIVGRAFYTSFFSMHHMFVIPKFRRRGLAYRLVQELANFTISKDASAIYWTVEDENVVGQTFYKSIGASDLIHTRKLKVWRLKDEQISYVIDRCANNSDLKSNSDKFQVREANPDDSAQILTLAKEMAPAIGLENKQLIGEECLSEALRCGKFHSLLAFCGDEFAGMLNYSFGYALWHGQVLHMRSPYIRKKYRNMSLDKILIQEIARVAVVKRILTVDCDFAENVENNPYEMSILHMFENTRHPFVLEKEVILQLSTNQ